MNIANSNITHQIVKQVHSEEGSIYFFNHVAVVEFNEGIHLDLNSGRKTVHDLLNHFGNTKPFGLISNRVNSYSIELMEINEIKSIFPNLVAYGIVSHNEAGRMNAEIESQYCASSNISFDNLYEGLDVISKRVLKHITVSLN